MTKLRLLTHHFTILLIAPLWLAVIPMLSIADTDLTSELLVDDDTDFLSDIGPEYLSDEPEDLDEASEASFQIVEEPFFVGDQLWRVHFRTYYLDRYIEGAPDRAAWAAGGWIDWQSPSFLKGVLKLGATVFGSQKIIGDKDKDGTGLLQPGQESYGGLSNAYVALDFDKATARLGRFEIEAPYLNRHDSRMTPNSFQGGQLLYDINPSWTLGVGYYTDIKLQTSTHYNPLYKEAGIPGGENYGVSALGLRFDDPLGWNQHGGLFYRHAPNFMDIYYAEYGQRIMLFDRSAIMLAGQYTRQESVGTTLDGRFKIDHYGARLTWDSKAFSAALAYTYYSKSNGEQLRSPWGGTPGYTAVIVQNFDRPGEHAALVGFGVDFTEFGVPGLVLSTSYTYGTTPDSGVAASPDQEEFDVTLAYTFQQSFLDGLGIRVRNGYVNQKNTNKTGPAAADINDFRVIVNYVWVY